MRPWARRSGIWIGCVLFLVYLPEVAWYAYLVGTVPDIGWSWQALDPLALSAGAGALVLVLCSTPQLKNIGSLRDPNTNIANPLH